MQRRFRNKLKLRILGFLKKKQPVTLSVLAYHLKKDAESIENAIVELMEKDLVGKKLLSFKTKKGKGYHYFLLPIDFRVNFRLLYDQHKTGLGKEFYMGIRKNIPLSVQLYQKFRWLSLKKKLLAKRIERRIKKNSRDPDLSELKEEFERACWYVNPTLKSIESYLEEYSRFGPLIDKDEYGVTSVLIHQIDSKYKIVDAFELDRRKGRIIPDLDKMKILFESLNLSNRKNAENSNVSSKTISNIIKEFSNKDGSFNVKKINAFYNKYYNVSNSSTGEMLESMRKSV